MTTCTCVNFFKLAGWHCQELDMPGGPTLYVATPLTLRGGKPLDFYLTPRGALIEFTDDGNTLFALTSIGYQLEDRRNWRGLENIALRYGFELNQAGAFHAVFPEREMQERGEKLIRFFSTLADWEDQHYMEGDTEFTLTEEVEMLLRAKDAAAKLERNVELNMGDQSFGFSFKWGETYVDAIKPIQQSINARIRKALVLGQALEDVRLLFIVDDRLSPSKADDEISVLGTVARAVRFTDFEKAPSSALH